MAAYNNYFPTTYTPATNVYGGGATPAQTWAAQTTTNLGAINWVQGEAGARSVFVPAGQKALLMDSESNVFYVKSSDASGIPLPLRVFEYTERTSTAAAQPFTSNVEAAHSTYVTHEELEQALAELRPKKDKLKEEKVHEFDI